MRDSVRIKAMVPAELHRAITAAAIREGESMATFIRRAVRREVARTQRKRRAA